MPQSNQKGRGGRNGPPSREVAVSKSLSLLLRHAAEREGLKMDSQGYANVADVLEWRKLKSLKVTFDEIVAAVETSDKKRFALLYLPRSESSASEHESAPEPPTATESESESTTATATALKYAETDKHPTHYLIRATQGHSIKTVEAESLLERLTLDNPEKLPDTVVHGTYHSTWPMILASGGLRCMGRNHAHFATGPVLKDVLGDIDSRKEKEGAVASTGDGDDPTGKVISGMRRDAQVLVYIDIRRALAGGCPFWRSENGVILSEGVEVQGTAAGTEMGTERKGEVGVIPIEFFDVVVERRKGLGVIWEKGEVIQTLPEHLTKKGGPKGGGRGGRGGGNHRGKR
ncbi:KptA family-domain-containing protein [Aspergillus californicus]